MWGEAVCQRSLDFQPGVLDVHTSPDFSDTTLGIATKGDEGLRLGGGVPNAVHRDSEGPVTKTSPGELTRQPLTHLQGCSAAQNHKAKQRGEERKEPLCLPITAGF